MPRKSTFNAAETNKLFKICIKYKNVIECKKSDCVSTKHKEEAWEKICQEFNATSEIQRQAKELKTKYKNVKYWTKLKAAEEKRTSGGPETSGALSAVEDKMVGMLSDKGMDGVPNNCDSDAVLPENIAKDIHLDDRKDSPSDLETPLAGPATLRSRTSAPLWTGRKTTKATVFEKLAAVKIKWSEFKMQSEVELVQKEKEKVELEMQHMREKHKLEILILRARLQREIQEGKARLVKPGHRILNN